MNDPIKALCYLEGYIERIMHEQGLEVEQSVRDRFEILHQHIDASAANDMEVERLKQAYDMMATIETMKLST